MWQFYGFSPLQIAVERSDEATTRFLLELGADIESEYLGPWRQTPLQGSIANNDKSMMNLLIELGASFKRNSQGESPLMTALIYARYNMFAQLKRAGAPIDFDYDELAKLRFGRQEPCISAVTKDNLKALTFLISIGADIRKPIDYRQTYLYSIVDGPNCCGVVSSYFQIPFYKLPEQNLEHAASEVDSLA